MPTDRRAAFQFVVEMRWAAFAAAETGHDPAVRHAAAQAVARLLGATADDPTGKAIGVDRLVHLLAALERAIADLRRGGDKHAEADMRHGLALLLRKYAAVLAGRPLRAAVYQELQALRLFRGAAPSLFVARAHHLAGLAARDAGYSDGIRDRERAVIHLERARLGFLAAGRPDRAADSALSAMDAWADRRIGDPVENFDIVRLCWQESRLLFRQAEAPLRAFAADIVFAQCLFRRRYQRSEAFDELIDLLGSVYNGLAELRDLPAGSPEQAKRRQLMADALSLLGATHGARPGRARFRLERSTCFGALRALLDETDPPAFLATHHLRLASYMLAETQAGRASLADAENAISTAVDAARLTGEPAKELAADFLQAQILAEAGKYGEAIARFRVVAAKRNSAAITAATVFGWEEEAQTVRGLAATGSLAALRAEGPLAAIRFFEQARLGFRGEAGAAPDPGMLAACCPVGGALVWILPQGPHSVAILATADGDRLQLIPVALPRLMDVRMRAGITGWLRSLASAGTGDTARLKPALDRLLADIGLRLARPLDRVLRRAGIAAGAEIVLLSTGILSLLPVQAAPLGGQRAFLDRYVLRTATRLADLASQTRPAPEIERRPLILTDPSGLGLTGFTEADRVAALFRQYRYPTPRIIERLASASQLARLLGAASHLHVTAHGEFGFADPLWSRIVIGDRQLAPAYLAQDAELGGCDLAFLANCGSGLADAGVGADLVTGLAGAFLNAGAGCVIGALWPIGDGPAGLLVDGFYRHYLAGEASASALRRAALSARERFPHPLDWAPSS